VTFLENPFLTKDEIVVYTCAEEKKNKLHWQIICDFTGRVIFRDKKRIKTLVFVLFVAE
jgi:hypothetical protein